MEGDEEDVKTFFKVSGSTDLFLRISAIMTEEQIERAVRSSMNVYIIFETEFKRRFPAAYARYEKEFDE